MDAWVGAVFVPLVVAGIGWIGSEFTGGAEGRTQRKVLAYLQIADKLGDTPEGLGARRVAMAETSRLLTERGTRMHFISAMTGVFLCWGVVALCVLIAVLTAVVDHSVGGWVMTAMATGLAVAYGFGAVQAWTVSRQVTARRNEQRPSVLVTKSDLARASTPTSRSAQ